MPVGTMFGCAYINIDKITHIYPKGGHTVVVMDDGYTVEIFDTLDEFMKRLKNTLP